MPFRCKSSRTASDSISAMSARCGPLSPTAVPPRSRPIAHPSCSARCGSHPQDVTPRSAPASPQDSLSTQPPISSAPSSRSASASRPRPHPLPPCKPTSSRCSRTRAATASTSNSTAARPPPHLPACASRARSLAHRPKASPGAGAGAGPVARPCARPSASRPSPRALTPPPILMGSMRGSPSRPTRRPTECAATRSERSFGSSISSCSAAKSRTLCCR